MPLTVVAPAELVALANCLAQLMDGKVINGTQQLVLKLFPLEETNSLDASGGDGGSVPNVGLKREVQASRKKWLPQSPCSPS